MKLKMTNAEFARKKFKDDQMFFFKDDQRYKRIVKKTNNFKEDQYYEKTKLKMTNHEFSEKNLKLKLMNNNFVNEHHWLKIIIFFKTIKSVSSEGMPLVYCFEVLQVLIFFKIEMSDSN